MATFDTKRGRETIVASLYTTIEDGTPPRDLARDDEGVVALIGGQHTNHVYFAERQSETTYRVLRLEPHSTRRPRVNRRTGRVDVSDQLNGCQYVVADITFDQSLPTQLGPALRDIQSCFRTAIRSPITSGTANNDRELGNLYRQWFGSTN